MPASVYVPSPLETLKVENDNVKATPQTQAMSVDSESDEDDSSLRTVDGLMRRRARLHPYDHAISYPSEGINFVDYTMQDLDVFAWRVAKHFESRLPVRPSSEERPMVVALLGSSNLEYLVTKLALSKLGHTVLLLSTRIPQPAIENLITMTGAVALLAEARYLELAGQVEQNMPTLQLSEIAGRGVFEFPVQVLGDTRLDAHLDPETEKNHIAFIIHSSGKSPPFRLFSYYEPDF